MHELQIAKNIIEIVSESFSPEEGRIKKVNLRIGALNHIFPESLRFYYDSLTEKYDFLKGSRLEILKIPVQVFCKNCNSKWELNEPKFLCVCGNSLEIIEGDEMLIESYEIGEIDGN